LFDLVVGNGSTSQRLLGLTAKKNNGNFAYASEDGQCTIAFVTSSPVSGSWKTNVKVTGTCLDGADGDTASNSDLSGDYKMRSARSSIVGSYVLAQSGKPEAPDASPIAGITITNDSPPTFDIVLRGESQSRDTGKALVGTLESQTKITYASDDCAV